MIFWPEHAEDISYVYAVNQTYLSLFLTYLHNEYMDQIG